MTDGIADINPEDRTPLAPSAREAGERVRGKKPFVPPQVMSEGTLTRVTTQFIGQFSA
jgi:hypothetical protein